GRGSNFLSRAKVHGEPERQLMRAEIGGDFAAANEITADHGTAQLVFDEQRQPSAEAPLDPTKQLEGRSGDLILEGTGRLRRVRPLHLDMRNGDTEIRDQVGSARRAPA